MKGDMCGLRVSREEQVAHGIQEEMILKDLDTFLGTLLPKTKWKIFFFLVFIDHSASLGYSQRSCQYLIQKLPFLFLC